MKLKNKIMLAALSMMALASCQKNEFDTDRKIENKEAIHFILKTGEDTKTFLEYDSEKKSYSAKWKNGDAIGMIFGNEIKDDSIKETLSNKNSDGTTATFEGTVTTEGEGTFQAVAPAASVVKFYDQTKSKVSFGFNVGTPTEYKQHPTKTSFDPTCDLLVSKPCDYVAEGGEVVIEKLYFTRMLAILKLSLTGEYAKDEKLNWVKVEGPNNLSGRVKVRPSDYSIVEWTAAKKYAWAEYTDEDQKPAINSDAVYLMVNPQTINIGQTITITASTDKYDISKTITLAGKAFSLTAGNVTGLNVAITEEHCTKKVKAGYILQTSSGAFEDGAKYIFALKDGADGSYYFINKNGSSNTLTKDKYTISEGKITTEETECVFTANTAETAGCFTFKNAESKYIYNSGSNTTLNTSSDNKTDWLPTFINDSKTYKLQVSSNSGRYISAADATKIAGYANSNFKDQVNTGAAIAQYAGAISVFKYDDGKEALTTPEGLNVSGKVVSWNTVDGAASYVVTVGSTEGEVTTNSYTFTGADEYYDVSVYAKPADTESYKKSEAAVLTKARFGTPKLATPELSSNGITTSSVSVKWEFIAKATEGYHCELFIDDKKQTEQDVNSDVKNVTFTDLTSGTEYTVKVNAKAVSGEYPYEASEVATINLTPSGTQVKDVTAEGTYTISDLVVYCVPDTKTAILGDETGKILLYTSNSDGHELVVGDKINANGSVVEYNKVWEFKNPTVNKVSTGAEVNHGDPVELSTLTSYTTSASITYVQATGVQSGQTITPDDYSTNLSLNTTYSDTDGYKVETKGYVYGYSTNSSKISYCPTSLARNGISASPTTVTLASAASSEIKVTVKSSGAWTANTSSQWTVSPDSGSDGSTEVTITASQAGGTTEATLDNLVFTLTGTEKAATVTVKQEGSVTLKGFPVNFTTDNYSTGVTTLAGKATWTSDKTLGTTSNGVYFEKVTSGSYYLFTIPVNNLTTSKTIKLALGKVKCSNNKYLVTYSFSYSLNGTNYTNFGDNYTETTSGTDITRSFNPSSSLSTGNVYIKMTVTSGGGTNGGNHYIKTVDITAE